MSVCAIDVGMELRKANEEGFQEGYRMGTVQSMSACTDEEFKTEAKRRGYYLQKKESLKLLPCTCGSNRRTEWWHLEEHGWFYECNMCGLTSTIAKTRKQAKLNWNIMIEEKMKDGKAD